MEDYVLQLYFLSIEPAMQELPSAKVSSLGIDESRAGAVWLFGRWYGCSLTVVESSLPLRQWC